MAVREYPGESDTARAIRERLLAEAGGSPTATRAATLRRFFAAFADIYSGEAARLAQIEAPSLIGRFRKGKVVRSTDIHAYVKLKKSLPGGDEWIGPWDTTIRADKTGMNAYLKERARSAGARRTARPHTQEIYAAIGRIADMNDQSLILKELEEGRRAKRRLDLAVHAFRKIAGVDLDDLLEAKFTPQAQAILADRRIFQLLVARITNDDHLAVFGLECRQGRVRMNYSPRSDLILPEELKAMSRAAGIRE